MLDHPVFPNQALQRTGLRLSLNLGLLGDSARVP